MKLINIFVKTTLIFILVLYLFPGTLRCQSYEDEKYLTINDGLSQNSATAILQDKKGFIWIGTNDGLNRYDGINCRVYMHTHQKNSLINNHITCLHEDSDGNIWVGTLGGLNKFISENEQFITLTEKQNDSICIFKNAITALLEDSEKNLWIGTRTGLKKLSGLKSKLIKQPVGIESIEVFNSKTIICLYEDNEKNIWIGADSDSLYCLFKSKKTIRIFPIDISRKGSNEIIRVSSVAELSDKEMLLGTSGNGVFIFDKRTEKLVKYNRQTDEQNYIYRYIAKIKKYGESCVVLTNRLLYKTTKTGNIPLWQNYTVPAPSAFLIDNSGIIWIGSNGGGIVKLIPIKEKFFTVTKEIYSIIGFSFSSIRAILDVNGNLFIGGYTGLLVSYNYPPVKPFWKRIDFFKDKNVYSLAIDPIDSNILWIGTEDAGLYKYNINSGVYKKYGNESPEGNVYSFADNVYDILVCRNDDLYFATQTGILKYDHSSMSFTKFTCKPDNSDFIGNGRVKTLCEDSYGNIWIGTDRSGISIYNPQKNIFTKIDNTPDENSTYSLSDNIVNIIFEDSKKNIWVGTADGLNKLIIPGGDFTLWKKSKKKSNLKIYRTKDGLPNDCVYGILEDNKGFLWLSTNKGLSKFDLEKETFLNYDVSYGLQSNEFNTGAYYKKNDGELFFGGIKGFTSFYPDEIVQNLYAPPVVITDFKKFNQPYRLDKSITYRNDITLDYLDYFFSFSFIMPEYSEPARHKFAYKLSGFDERWIFLANGERSATFTSIPPGEYIFYVKGTNSDGVWSAQVTSLRIIIYPAFWNTWWFRLTAISLFCLLIYLLYRSRINRLKQEKEIQKDLSIKLLSSQEEERKNISAELHDDLGQNLLVVKNKLMLSKRDKNFEENINDVLDILDNSIQDVSDISHLLHPSELEALGLTQAIESMVYRIESASNIKIKNNLFPTDEYFAEEERINVFRIFQESLNNILKHAGATEVIFESELKKKSLILTIKDNGVGFEYSKQPNKNQRPHIGLNSMKDRALMLNGILTIDSALNKGTIIKIEFDNKIKD